MIDIDALIDYITKKGYLPRVLPRRICISKYFGEGDDDIGHIDWAISQLDLKYMDDSLLYWQANQKMQELDQAIAMWQKEGLPTYD